MAAKAMINMLDITRSVPVRVTSTKPMGKTKALMRIEREGFEARRMGEPPATMRSKSPSMEMNAPPRKDLMISSPLFSNFVSMVLSCQKRH